jgi:pyruvate,orthophosphate dikinase
MKYLLDEYGALLKKKGLSIPDEPAVQLREAVRAVYRSWHSERAGEFRRGMSVSAHWGTAVVVMAMVRANAPGAGASVFFTRNPMTLEPMAWGESRRMSTGDDLVGGRAYSRPLAREQTDRWETLEERGPDLYRRHAEIARRIESVMGLPQEVEAAYVGKKMYVLQTKRMEFRRGRAERFDAVCKMESAIIGRGIGVYGGAMSGAATFARTAEEVRALREKLGDEPVILVRHETSTDDVALMGEIDGILTAVGGASSHAAILAQKFGLTAVVGSPDVVVGRAGDGSPQAEIGTYPVVEGTPLSLDGSTGVIYSGVCGFVVKERWY